MKKLFSALLIMFALVAVVAPPVYAEASIDRMEVVLSDQVQTPSVEVATEAPELFVEFYATGETPAFEGTSLDTKSTEPQEQTIEEPYFYIAQTDSQYVTNRTQVSGAKTKNFLDARLH
jgi:hypothetical protein